MFSITILGVSLIAIVAVLTQLFKKLIADSRWHPVLAMFIGFIVLCLSKMTIGVDYILPGIVTGLMASGFFDVINRTILDKG